MNMDQRRLGLNAFAARLKQAFEPMKAIWAMSESSEVNQVFHAVMSLTDFRRIQSISDARGSEVLKHAAGGLADLIKRYAKEFGDTPVLLCRTLMLADNGNNLRVQVSDPGFSIHLWFDETHAHFDMALRGARLS